MNRILYIALLLCTSCFSQVKPTVEDSTQKKYHIEHTGDSLGQAISQHHDHGFEPIAQVSAADQTIASDQLLTEIPLNELSFIDPSLEDGKLAAVLFLGTDCPISQKYVSTLRKLSKTYKESVYFIGLFPESFSDEAILEFQKSYNIPFKVKRDLENDAARTFHASHTPHVYLIGSAGEIKYQGAIDNWFYALGKNRRKVTEPYLENAINAVLLGEAVKVKHTQPIGCFIEF